MTTPPPNKFVKFLSKNAAMIVGVSVIVASHWVWVKLQDTPLVPEHLRRELPIVSMGKRFWKRLSSTDDEVLSGVGTEKPN